MTTNTIERIYSTVTQLLEVEDKLSCVVAGGAVTDHYYNKEVADVDIFLSSEQYLCEDKVSVLGMAGFSLFRPTKDDKKSRFVFDSYGDLSFNELSNKVKIVEVYKGNLFDTPVDLVFVNHNNMDEYIGKYFDQSIKCAYYNGEYCYLPAFKKTILTNTLFPVKAEPSEYVRAYLAAQKYDLKLSSLYELSKELCSVAYDQDLLGAVISKSTLLKLENHTSIDDFFDIKHNDNKSIASLFYTHKANSTKLWKELRTVVAKDVITESPLNDVSFDVKLPSTDYENFRDIVQSALFHIQYSNEEYLRLLKGEFTLLHELTREEFIQGKFTDVDGRTVRLGRYLTKITRKVAGCHILLLKIKELSSVFEKRGVQTTERVFFSGTKHSLVNISTNTKWSSCQRVNGFFNETPQSYGVLANLSGNTLVAYTTSNRERSDHDSSQWSSRALVRIGEDGSLIIEKAYSNIDQIKQGLVKAIRKELRALGYVAHSTRKEAFNFVSLPYISTPYGDTPYVSVYKENGKIVQCGLSRRERINSLITKLRHIIPNIDHATPLDFDKDGIADITDLILSKKEFDIFTELKELTDEVVGNIDIENFNVQGARYQAVLKDTAVLHIRRTGYEDHPAPSTFGELLKMVVERKKDNTRKVKIFTPANVFMFNQ